MTETKHTPGPLTLEREIPVGKLGMDPKHLATEMQRGGFTIGYWIDCEWDGHCPNAKLFAAAPDLLTACIAALSQLTEDRPEYLEFDVAQLRAAIAHAEKGE